MKKMQFLACAFATALLSFSLVGCSKDEPVNPNTPEVPEESNTHFDIWVSIGETSGMGSDATILVKSLDSLEAQPTIDFKNDGVDVTATIKQETIVKGKYYYQVPVSEDRFGKYQLVDNKLVTVVEHPFDKNTFKARKYSHAWLDDNTLLIIAANGKANKVIWTKLNAETMKIIAEGELSLTCKEGDKFSTSGLAYYRKSDNRLIYFFTRKSEEKNFYAAFINPETMSIEKEVKEDRAEQMAGTAFGELLQSKMFADNHGDLYLACSSDLPNAGNRTEQYSCLLRIKDGETDFDKSYKGFNYNAGKIVTAEYLTEGKALLYIQDPTYTGAAGWGKDYNSYYAVLDLTTDEKKELEYEGKVLPYSSGTFSQRSLVRGDEAYIGVNPKDAEPCVYIFNIKSGEVRKGMTISEGYEFNRIVLIDNEGK